MKASDIRLADPRFGADAISAVARVLASGRLTEGPVVAEFEAAIAEACGAGHGIATSSATTALELALAALDLRPDDEVAVADFTYPATGNAVLQRGGRLRLVDVDLTTYCIDAEALAAALGDRTAAVIAVDVFGLPADYARIEPLLAERGIPLICDAACALGGMVAERRCGTFGQMSVFSFHPRKSLTTGEGGMITTNDAALATRLRRLRNHGSERDGWRARFIEPGFNYRMSELNAAVGLVQVPGHADIVARRRALAAELTHRLRNLGCVSFQREPVGHCHPYQAYVITLADDLDRNAIVDELRAKGIEATIGTYALHAEPAFAARCGTQPGDLTRSYRLGRQTLAIPLHQGMDAGDVERVAVGLRSAIAIQGDRTPLVPFDSPSEPLL